MRKLLLSTLVFAAALSAKAQDITLGEPGYGGNGCPQGSASAILSPDGTELSILFDQMIAEAGNLAGKRLDRKSCNLAIPINIPQGYSVSLLKVDYRGFNLVPMGATNRLAVEYFFAGARGPRVDRVFRGPLSDNFMVTDQLIASAMVWSPCGAQVNFRVNANITAQSNMRGDQTMASLDSTDVSAKLLYKLQWRRCQ